MKFRFGERLIKTGRPKKSENLPLLLRVNVPTAPEQFLYAKQHFKVKLKYLSCLFV